MIKRRILGVDYGAVVISEGVFHSLSDEEIKRSGIHFSYDDHGHPELGKVSKAHVFCELIDSKLAQLGLKIKCRPVEVGYEVRCGAPLAYDREYCTLMGLGVYQLFTEKHTGCMVYASKGEVRPLFLKDLQDPATGKIPPRLVDINSGSVQSIIRNMLHYIMPADYAAAKKYVQDPETYDMFKILNWI